MKFSKLKSILSNFRISNQNCIKIDKPQKKAIYTLLFLLLVITFYPNTELTAQTISSPCGSNNSLKVEVDGLLNVNGTVNVPLGNKVKRLIAECTCRSFDGATCPPSINFTTDGTNVTVNRKDVRVCSSYEGNDEGFFYVYRLYLNKKVNSLIYNAPSSSKDREGMRGLTTWIVNNDLANANQPSSAIYDKFLFRVEKKECRDISINQTNFAKDVIIHIPATEIQNRNDRFTRYTAVALYADGSVAATLTPPVTLNTFNDEGEIRLDQFEFNNVPGTATTIRVCIESPERDPLGTSYMVASAAVTYKQQLPAITCPQGGTVACAEEINTGKATVQQNCPNGSTESTVSGPDINGPSNCPGATYTYTHLAGGASCKQVFTIQNDAPVIFCLENVQVVCEADINPGFAEYSVSCGVEAEQSISEPIISGEPGCAGTTYTFTYTVTDACGRSTSCEQVFILDAECAKDCSCKSNLKSIIEVDGIHNIGNLIDIPMDGKVVKVTAESTCRGFRGSTCPASITYTVNGENVTVVGTPVTPYSSWIPNPPGTSEGDFFIYRLAENKPVTSLQYNPPTLSTDQEGMRGLTTFIVSEDAENANNASNAIFDNFLFRVPERCKNISIHQSTFPRDFTIHIPVSEIQNNPSRYTRYRAEALDTNGNVIATLAKQLFNGNNKAPEIRLDTLLFKNVPAEAETIKVCIESPLEGNIIGTSFMIGSIMVTSEQETPIITCPEDREVTCADDIGLGTPIIESICPNEEISIEIEGPIINGELNCPNTTYTFIYTVAGVSCEQVFTIADNQEDNTCICETGLCNLQDWRALKAFYENTDGENNWTQDYGWDQVKGDTPPVDCDLSNMYGVTLTDEGRVEQIYSYDNGLSGTLPPEIGDMTELIALYLASGNLMGSIPVELAKLKKLEKLFLAGNNLSGTIPSELGQLTNLTDFRLQGNQLSGAIPVELCNLVNLKYFGLDNNQLSGTIPACLKKLSKVQFLCMSDNQLTGNLPESLSALDNINYFSLHNNNLSGCYAPILNVLCNQLRPIHNKELDFNFGNNFDADWVDFCANDSGACNSPKLSDFSQFRLYPNPTEGKVFVKFENKSDQKSIINVYNISGKNYKVISQKGNNSSVELDLSKQPKGVYIIEIHNNQSTQIEKLILH